MLIGFDLAIGRQVTGFLQKVTSQSLGPSRARVPGSQGRLHGEG